MSGDFLTLIPLNHLISFYFAGNAINFLDSGECEALDCGNLTNIEYDTSDGNYSMYTTQSEFDSYVEGKISFWVMISVLVTDYFQQEKKTWNILFFNVRNEIMNTWYLRVIFLCL